jgi:pimeloyl-ACP methyl ester carboxylesterase
MRRLWVWLSLAISTVQILVFVPSASGQTENGMKSGFAEVNGVKLHYVENGKGRLILFLHGFPEFWYAWKNQLVEFGKDMHAVAVDMRGYNLSDKPEKVEEYAVPKLVEDVKGLIDKLNKGTKIILVGHDWGGVVAWVFAAMHPDYIDKLVIINAPHPGVFSRELANNPDQQKASGYMNMFRSPQAETILSANNYGALVNAVITGAKPGSFSEEDKKEYLKAWTQPRAITGGLNYYRAAQIGPPVAGAKSDAAPKLPTFEVKVPTLVIWGEKDTALLTGNLIGLEKFVSSLTVKRIPTGGHWVVHEEPEQINKMIREFVGK